MAEPNLDDERLDVYRLSIEYLAFSYGIAQTLTAVNQPARDHWIRAARSISLS